jgi:hypothetical protein
MEMRIIERTFHEENQNGKNIDRENYYGGNHNRRIVYMESYDRRNAYIVNCQRDKYQEILKLYITRIERTSYNNIRLGKIYIGRTTAEMTLIKTSPTKKIVMILTLIGRMPTK